LFGSYVRERQKKKSDIDLFDFFYLRKYLEGQLKPAIGRHILSEVEYV